MGKNSLETAKKLMTSTESSEYNISSPSWMNPILYYSSTKNQPDLPINSSKYFTKTVLIPTEEIANSILSSSRGLISSINSISDEMEREHKIDEYYRLIKEIDMYEDFLCEKGKLKEAYANIELAFIPIIELTDAEKSMLIDSIFYKNYDYLKDTDVNDKYDFYKRLIRLTQHHKINPLIILADIIKNCSFFFSYENTYLSGLIKDFERITLAKKPADLEIVKKKIKESSFKFDSYGFLDILYPYETSNYYELYEIMMSIEFCVHSKSSKKQHLTINKKEEAVEIPINSKYFLSSPTPSTLADNFSLELSEFCLNDYYNLFRIPIKHDHSLFSSLALVKAMCEYYEQKDLSSYVVSDKFNQLSITIDKINQDIVLSNLRSLHLALRTEVRRYKFENQ